MSQHEYIVPLASAKPHQMDAVARAYWAGVEAEQKRILELLGGELKYGFTVDLLTALRKDIERTGKY